MSKYIILSFCIEYNVEYVLREYIACESFLISIAMFSVLVSFIIGTNVVVLLSAHIWLYCNVTCDPNDRTSRLL